MKPPLMAFMLIIPSFATFAQKELPRFGKIDKADLVMTECDFDKDALLPTSCLIMVTFVT
jgi:hypothetical protein